MCRARVEHLRPVPLPRSAFRFSTAFISLNLSIEHPHEHGPPAQKEAPADVEAGAGTQMDRLPSSSATAAFGHPLVARQAFVQAAEGVVQVPELAHHNEAQSSATTAPVAGPHKPSDKKKGGHDHSHGNGSMNMRAVLLHVLGDALGNLGVIGAGLVIWLSRWPGRAYLDPAVSLAISGLICAGALPLVRRAAGVLLQRVPTEIALRDVRAAIAGVAGVRGVHELHVWQLSEAAVVASVHVRADPARAFMATAADIRARLHALGIHSSTIQPEYDEDEDALEKVRGDSVG
jgi:solute carrier family 30 (zinc transporter), member 1